MNCSLYCIPSYGQVYNVKHWHTCQCSELLWLLPARARIFPFDSASGGVCVCERGRERVPLTEKMSSPNSMNPILRDVNIFREHLALSVFSYALFLPCLLLHHSHVLGGNIGLNSLSLTPILLVWREVQKKATLEKVATKTRSAISRELHLSSAIWRQLFLLSSMEVFWPIGQYASPLLSLITELRQDVKRKGGATCKPIQQRTRVFWQYQLKNMLNALWHTRLVLFNTGKNPQTLTICFR